MSICPYNIRQVLMYRLPELSEDEISILVDIFLSLH